MANVTPDVVFPTMTVDVTGLTIPYADLDGLLTQAEADPTTGDIREVMRAILEKYATAINALDAALRPTEATITKSNPAGQGLDTVRQTYTATFDGTYDKSTFTPTPEPS